MRKRILIFSVWPLLLAFIGGCGGSGHSTSTANEVPVVVSVSDQPPTGISVLSFDVTIAVGLKAFYRVPPTPFSCRNCRIPGNPTF